jgi:pyruvate dehydrogenase E2 component (dihydrolipoamide acetyltransferase)
MAQDINLNMDGMLLNWLKDVGDAVKAGDIIAEFEADKATVEVESPADGVLVELIAEVGEEYGEGDIIAKLGEAGEASASSSAPAPADVGTQPAVSETPTSSNGASQPATGADVATRTPDGRIKASPLAKRVAEDRNVDLSMIAGSGPGGRITKEDVENFDPSKVQAPTQPATPAKSSAPASSSAPAIGASYGALPEASDDVEIVELSRMRKAIAKGTITSFQTTPHFYVLVEMDVAPLLKLRKELNATLEDEGIKISVNDMIVKAVALTLKKFPNLNSHYYGDHKVINKRINVAIAVALPDNGLVNVVSPDADKASLSAMAVYHKQMFDDSREGKIKQEYIKNGTFLVSNLGAYGVESFSSIIDPATIGGCRHWFSA